MRWDWFEGLNENAPIDVMPASNMEYYPLPATEEQKMVMAIQDQWIEETRGRYKMSRRHFVRTSMAFAIGLAAIDLVYSNKAKANPLGAQPGGPDYCAGLVDQYNTGTQLTNLPGEFIFDVQSHHVMSDGVWRAMLPVHWAVIAGVFGFADNKDNPRETDPTENVGRVHYMKDMFLDSATNMTVISPVPAAPDITNPLPMMDAIESAEIFQELSGGTSRSVIHKFCMPNRGSTMTGKAFPLFMQAEFDEMEQFASMPRAQKYLRGFKVYSPYADVPFAPSWQHDDDIGQAFANHVLTLSKRYPMIRPTIASHKGPILPGFNGNSNAPQDMGPAAKMFPEISFIVYHSGHNSGFPNPDATTAVSPDKAGSYYPGDNSGVRDENFPHSGDDQVNNTTNAAGQHVSEISVDTLIKSVRSVGLDGPHNKPYAGASHGNCPNVFAEIGSTWQNAVGGGPRKEAFLLGKLVWHVGPRRIVWGTDSVWYGSPQAAIVALRNLSPILDPVTMTTKSIGTQNVDDIWATYNLPFGLQGDRFDPQVDVCDPTKYTSSHPNATLIPGWPTDGQKHPERSIRNGIFGRNAAEVYGLAVDDPDKTQLDTINQRVSCHDLQKLRDEYWFNQFSDTNRTADPNHVLARTPRTNAMPAPRTPAQVRALKKKEGWAP